ncbi:MAG: HAMP domain-containing protein [Alphaproteobacteria bacterium]|nr:HAMP domain-containing protein [Alphaproteobacteria bacterium]
MTAAAVLSRVIPSSLAGRAVLALVIGLLVSNVVIFVVASSGRDAALNAQQRQRVAERIAELVPLVEEVSADRRESFVRRASATGLLLRWGPAPLAAPGKPPESVADLAAAVAALVNPREVRAATEMFFGPMPWMRRFHGRDEEGRSRRERDRDRDRDDPRWAEGGPRPPREVSLLSVRLGDASWLNVYALVDIPYRDRTWQPRHYIAFALVGIVAVLLTAWAVRRATRPLDSFARAAERFGADLSAPPLPDDGPREVRQAARAFNGMQDRLRRFVRDRTEMLAAISHDLRTPITRLRLRAEFVEDEEAKAKMLADLGEMETMIAATLEFARDDVAREARREVDLVTLLKDLIEGTAGGGYAGPDKLMIEAAPNALKRAFANLVDNALKYGAAARVRLGTDATGIVIAIDDDGPGIPEGDRERVFAPFTRLEASRNRETGGVGLGLAVARNAVRAHGGDITLANRREGGLTATVTLPTGLLRAA